MRRLLVMLVLAGSSAHAASARVAPVGPTRKPDSNALTDRVVKFAEHQIGVPYRFGGSSHRSGFDCSGLVYAAYRSIGRAIPHSTWGQMALGTRVGFLQLRPGDLLFTEGGRPCRLGRLERGRGRGAAYRRAGELRAALIAPRPVRGRAATPPLKRTWRLIGGWLSVRSPIPGMEAEAGRVPPW